MKLGVTSLDEPTVANTWGRLHGAHGRYPRLGNPAGLVLECLGASAASSSGFTATTGSAGPADSLATALNVGEEQQLISMVMALAPRTSQVALLQVVSICRGFINELGEADQLSSPVRPPPSMGGPEQHEEGSQHGSSVTRRVAKVVGLPPHTALYRIRVRAAGRGRAGWAGWCASRHRASLQR